MQHESLLQIGGIGKSPLAGLAALGLGGLAPTNTGGLNPAGKSNNYRLNTVHFWPVVIVRIQILERWIRVEVCGNVCSGTPFNIFW